LEATASDGGVIPILGDRAEPPARRTPKEGESMKKILFFTCVLAMVASTAFAHDTAKRLGLGFNSTSTPLGVRYWFSPKMGLDVGVGFLVDDNAFGTDSATDWAFSAGLPINLLHVGDRVNMHFLPWVQYSNIDLGNDQTGTVFDIVAGLEFEVFVTNDLSVSAIQGVQFEISGGDFESETDISTIGDNLTEFGVHYYLPGGGGGGE